MTETRRRLEAVRDRLRQNGHSFMRTAPTAARFMREDADTIDAALAALPAEPPPTLDGPRLKTPLDGEYATALAVIHRQQVEHAALAALVRRLKRCALELDSRPNRGPEAARVAHSEALDAYDAALDALLAYPLAEDTDGGGA